MEGGFLNVLFRRNVIIRVVNDAEKSVYFRSE